MDKGVGRERKKDAKSIRSQIKRTVEELKEAMVKDSTREVERKNAQAHEV